MAGRTTALAVATQLIAGDFCLYRLGNNWVTELRRTRRKAREIAGTPKLAIIAKNEQLRGYKWLRYAEKDGRDGRI